MFTSFSICIGLPCTFSSLIYYGPTYLVCKNMLNLYGVQFRESDDREHDPQILSDFTRVPHVSHSSGRFSFCRCNYHILIIQDVITLTSIVIYKCFMLSIFCEINCHIRYFVWGKFACMSDFWQKFCWTAKYFFSNVHFIFGPFGCTVSTGCFPFNVHVKFYWKIF